MDDIDLSGIFEGFFCLLAQVPELVIWLFSTLWGWVTMLCIAAAIFIYVDNKNNAAEQRQRAAQQQVKKQ